MEQLLHSIDGSEEDEGERLDKVDTSNMSPG